MTSNKHTERSQTHVLGRKNGNVILFINWYNVIIVQWWLNAVFKKGSTDLIIAIDIMTSSFVCVISLY